MRRPLSKLRPRLIAAFPEAEPYAVGAARLRYRPWLVVVRPEPQSVLLVPIDRLLGEGVDPAIAIALLVSLFGVGMAGRLSSPFRTLTEAGICFSAGERGVEVAVHSHDEAGELARAFNDMIGRIRTHTAELFDEETLARNHRPALPVKLQ